MHHLNVKICRKNGKFAPSFYREPTFSGASTNYKSFFLTYQKMGRLHALLHRSFNICCDFKTFQFEIDHLKTIFMKNNIPRISLIRILNYFLISCIHLKLLFRMYLKEIFLLSCRFWEKYFKFERSFKNYLVMNKHYPLESKAFLPSKISYLRYYFQDLYSSINMVAAMLPIIVTPNAILRSEFVNI